jgi:hypothetical protein
MKAILKFHFLHLSRSRLLPLWLLFSVLTQYVVVKILGSTNIQIQGNQAILGVKEIVTVLLYAQFFLGSLLATVYGVWVVPYFHEDSRGPLTFALPVSKWIFPLVYGMTFVFMLLSQALLGFGVLFFHGGKDFFASAAFPWQLLLSGQLTTAVALLVMVYGLACLSFYLGKAATFILSSALLLVLQVSGALFKNEVGLDSLWRKVYLVLPPFGEVLIDLSGRPFWEGAPLAHFALWCIWLCLCVTIFRFRIART